MRLVGVRRTLADHNSTHITKRSSNVLELLKRDRSYVQSYSQFCQAQATTNQPTWQVELEPAPQSCRDRAPTLEAVPDCPGASATMVTRKTI